MKIGDAIAARAGADSPPPAADEPATEPAAAPSPAADSPPADSHSGESNAGGAGDGPPASNSGPAPEQAHDGVAELSAPADGGDTPAPSADAPPTDAAPASDDPGPPDDAAAIDAAVPPEQRAELRAAQEDLSHQLDAAASDEERNELQTQYHSTHDYWVDDDGTTYVADWSDNELRLTRRNEQTQTEDGAVVERDRVIDVHADGGRTTRTKVHPPGQPTPGVPYESIETTSHTGPDGTVTGGEVTTSRVTQADGASQIESATVVMDAAGTPTSQISRLVQMGPEGIYSETTETELGPDGTPRNQTTTAVLNNSAQTKTTVEETSFQNGVPHAVDIQSTTVTRESFIAPDGAIVDPGVITTNEHLDLDAQGVPTARTLDATIVGSTEDPTTSTTVHNHLEERYAAGEVTWARATTDTIERSTGENNAAVTSTTHRVSTWDGAGGPVLESSYPQVSVDRTITVVEEGDYSAHSAPMHTKTTTITSHAEGLGASNRDRAAGIDDDLPWTSANVTIHHEGFDDDEGTEEWNFSADELAENGLPKEGETGDKVRDSWNVDWHEDLHDWAGSNLWKVGAALGVAAAVVATVATAGAAAPLAVGLGAAAFGVAAVDTANQINRIRVDDQGSSWVNVGLSAIGLIPGIGNFGKAARAAGGAAAAEGQAFRAVLSTGIRTGATAIGTNALGSGAAELGTHLLSGAGTTSAVRAAAGATRLYVSNATLLSIAGALHLADLSDAAISSAFGRPSDRLFLHGALGLGPSTAPPLPQDAGGPAGAGQSEPVGPGSAPTTPTPGS